MTSTSSTADDLADGSDTSAAVIREQLKRLLASPDFNASERLKSFLSFVVEETLAGRSHRIKAYSIATHVLGRGDDFDLVNDPVVRIEAGRLRRTLERYYLLSGRDDPIVIDIPKGTYVPHFRRRDVVESAKAEPEKPDRSGEQPPRQPRPRRARFRRVVPLALAAVATACLAVAAALGLNAGPTAEADGWTNPEVNLVVSPFANLSGPDGAFFSAGISEELLSQLARFRELRIFGREASKALPSPVARSARAQYALEGGVRIAGQRLRVSARLLDDQTGRILWSDVYDRDLRGTGSFEIEADIAAKVAMAVAQPYGAIFTPVSRDVSARIPANAAAHLCVLRFYEYRRVLGREEHAATRECLEQITTRNPDYSSGWAMLAFLYLDEDRFDLNRSSWLPAGRVRAREAAKRAIDLDPSNARALQAMMTILFFDGEPEEAIRIGERALALNPNDTETLSAIGSRIALFGDWQRGGRMMEDALARNPAQTGFMVLIAQAHYMLGDDKKAVEWIRRADQKRFSIYHFIAALIFARAGLEQEAKASVAEFLRTRPRYFDTFDSALARRNFNARDRLFLINGARQAGFPVGPVDR